MQSSKSECRFAAPRHAEQAISHHTTQLSLSTSKHMMKDTHQHGHAAGHERQVEPRPLLAAHTSGLLQHGAVHRNGAQQRLLQLLLQNTTQSPHRARERHRHAVRRQEARADSATRSSVAPRPVGASLPGLLLHRHRQQTQERLQRPPRPAAGCWPACRESAKDNQHTQGSVSNVAEKQGSARALSGHAKQHAAAPKQHHHNRLAKK